VIAFGEDEVTCPERYVTIDDEDQRWRAARKAHGHGTAVDRCEVDHEAVKRDPVAFAALDVPPFGELQPTYDEEPGAPQFLLMRNCKCGTTLYRPVTP
jgi:hypothetical protein